MIQWIRTHKFEAHLISFALMILASIGLYYAINTDMAVLIWILVSLFALANLLAMVIK